MPEDEWRQQNAYLQAQIQALRSGPKSRWRKFRLLTWECSSCGDAFLEVMDTKPWRVVLTRQRLDPEGRRHKVEGTTGWTFHAIPDARPEEAARTILPAQCRCQNHDGASASQLWDDLDRGVRKRKWKALHQPPSASSPAPPTAHTLKIIDGRGVLFDPDGNPRESKPKKT